MAIDRSASANFHGCVLWLDAARVAWRTRSRGLPASRSPVGAIGRLISATASSYEGRSPFEQAPIIGKAARAAMQLARNRRLEGVLGLRSASPMPFFLMPRARREYEVDVPAPRGNRLRSGAPPQRARALHRRARCPEARSGAARQTDRRTARARRA